jgi:uncharacterized RDD family membrane protein YckC
MQCPSCRAVYSNGLSFCPRCKTPATKPSTETQPALSAEQPAETRAPAAETNDIEATVSNAEAAIEAEKAAPPASTLIEFPGVSRNKPQWRKELSERVREIQERRAREGTRETVSPPVQHPAGQPAPAAQLGLVPQPDAPAVNPIVAAALKRLERASQSSQHMTRTRATMRGAATAVARVAEEQYQSEEGQELELGALSLQMNAPQPQDEAIPEETVIETAREREHTLVVVPPTQPPPPPPTASTVEHRHLTMKAVDEESLFELDEATLDATPAEAAYDDRAPVVSRVVGSFIDLLVVAFASSPFAAIIELTNGNWSDVRVVASMCGIILTIMFLYLAASTALVGRTWGMSLLSIRAVDVDSGLPPTTKQAVWRALLYMISLASFGLGILYALFDAEGRTAHDHLSGTAVVRE